MKSWGEQQQFPTEVLNETEHLKAENQKLKERVAELESWMRAANGFMWAHERNCPRRNADEVCTCGLDSFLSRPRPFMESYRERIVELETELAKFQEVAQSEQESVLDAWIMECADYAKRNRRLQQSRGRLVSLVRAARQKIDELETKIARFDGWTGN